MDGLAARLGVTPVTIEWLRRNPGWRDVPALIALVRLMRRERPDLVHTHAAKGGTLGRLAALLSSFGRPGRPVLIHTFHGHSLTGYFSARSAEVYRRVERFLARHTDRLIAVSDEVRDELVGLGVAEASKFEVVRLGFDLSAFTVTGEERQRARDQLRAEFGIPSTMQVVTLIARLVPIKRVDRFLAVASALSDLPGIRFLVVGDGELREQLITSPRAVELGDRVVWAGLRTDMPAVCFASDVVVQTSDNEGTPVSLIEAQAAGVPVLSTRVGGAKTVVEDDRFLPAVNDDASLVRALRLLLLDPELASSHAAAGRARVLTSFGLERLLADLDGVYRNALNRRATRCRVSIGLKRPAWRGEERR